MEFADDQTCFKTELSDEGYCRTQTVKQDGPFNSWWKRVSGPDGKEEGEPTRQSSGCAPKRNHTNGLGGLYQPGSCCDKVKIPADLKPGRYVLSWRWDCVETYQIWSNCADIDITGGGPAPSPTPSPEPAPEPTPEPMPEQCEAVPDRSSDRNAIDSVLSPSAGACCDHCQTNLECTHFSHLNDKCNLYTGLPEFTVSAPGATSGFLNDKLASVV